MSAHDDNELRLRERIKELQCLNEATRLFGETGRNTDDVYSQLLPVIKAAFQFPERLQVHLILGNTTYNTPGYRPRKRNLTEPVTLNGQVMGTLTVCYDGAKPPEFLPEEQTLLRNLAQMTAYYRHKQESEQRLEETIGELEQRSVELESLLNALPDFLFVLDGDGTITDYRAGRQDELALPPESFLNRNIGILFPPVLSARLLDMIRRTLAGEKNLSTEYHLDISGTTSHYETRLSRYGKNLVIALVHNITDRVLDRERLIQSEEHYRSLIDSSESLIAMVDPGGNCLYMNTPATEFFNVPAAGVSETNIMSFFSPEQGHSFLDTIQTILETDTGKVFRQIMNTGNGERWFRTSVQPVHGPDGKAHAVMINASEITAIREAEQKIQRSERNYHTLFDSAPYGYMISRDDRIIECNEAAARMIRADRDKLIGLSIADVSAEVQPNGRRSGEYAAELNALAREKGSVTFEWLATRFDGTPLLSKATLGIVEYDNEPLVFATWRDITREREAEAELKTFRAISDQANIGNAITDIDGNLIYVNEELARMHGRTVEELMGQHLSILHSENQMVTVNSVLDELKRKGETSAQEIWHARSDGSAFPTLMNVKLIRDENNTPKYLVSTAMDISDIKYKEAEIRKLNLAIEQSPVALVVTDLNGVITYVSPAFTRITGYEKEEAIGQRTSILKSGKTSRAVYQELWETITKGGSWTGEWVNRRKDGTFYAESDTICPIFDENGSIINYLAIKEDVTLSRQAENERIARTVAEEASKSKMAFFSNMSHEIRTPLNAIIGFAQILERDQTLGKQQHRQIGIIAQSGDHLLKLVNDILDFSRIESGKMTLEPSNFDLQKLLDYIHAMFTTAVSKKGLTLSCEWMEPLPRFVNADEKKIRQVLINILGNAVKFTKVGGVAFRVKAEQLDGTHILKAEIEDSGTGIAPEDLDHIFDSFRQSQAGREIGGTGLGLAISRQLVELMGGSIRVESTPGKGSIFRIDIPVRVTDKKNIDTEQNTVSKISRLKPGTPPVRILIADDIEVNCILLRTVLVSAGFEVNEAHDGIETLQAVHEWKPHAVLLDLRMPRMDGYETMRKLILNPETENLPVIAVTASAFEEDRKTVAEAGFSGYIRKPFRPQEIFEVLQSLLKLDFILTEPVRDDEQTAELLTAKDMLTLDVDTKAALRTTLEQGDVTRFRELLEPVEAVSPKTATAMREMIDRYEYDRLIALLSES